MGPVSFECLPVKCATRSEAVHLLRLLTDAGVGGQLLDTSGGNHQILVRAEDLRRAMEVIAPGPR